MKASVLQRKYSIKSMTCGCINPHYSKDTNPRFTGVFYVIFAKES